ncbi:cyclase family protein [Castellaniella sp.]|uniref:cyclase family protein n=1 Tax=Castellaniella sp. TaxID=1955812 RepID=UPI0035607EB4
MTRWTRRPEGSNWGDFGPDDQLGRLNLLGPEQVLKGVREVLAGRSFCLSLPLDLPGGNVLNVRRRPPQLSPTTLEGVPYMNFALAHVDATAIDVLCDDQVLLSLQYSTQWDSLAHVGAQFDVDGNGQPSHVYYNGYRAGADDIGPPRGADGAPRLGIENLAAHGMQGRAVLVDLARYFGPGRTLVGYGELAEVMRAGAIAVEAGDMLLLRTGFAEAVVDMAGQPDAQVLDRTGAVLDGRDPDLLQWITDSGIVAICTDNYAVEAYPARACPGRKALLPLHHHCLFRLGLPLAELWYLKDLADWLDRAGRHRCLLTAPPLRLPGAVGSPVTPVATV